MNLRKPTISAYIAELVANSGIFAYIAEMMEKGGVSAYIAGMLRNVEGLQI